MPQGLDTARLYTQLLNTRLQQKDNALYQVIYSLIGAVAGLDKSVSASSSGGGSGSTVINEIQNVIISDNNESNGNSNNDMVIPGPPGPPGKDGLMGVMLIDDGCDNETFYIMGQ